jgi:hypothetical protein
MLKQILCGTVLMSSILLADGASAQPRRWEAAGSRNEVGRSARQLNDDIRDLQRFEATLAAYDDAWRRRDLGSLRAALQSFVAQGRIEVAEQQRETRQAFNEARRSNWEARRDGTFKDHRDAQDDRRDAFKERQELMMEAQALNDLERAAAANFAWGPSVPILINARQAMLRFIQLARVEVRRSHRELREDVREMREDNRDYRRGGPRGGGPYGQPGYGAQPPPPGYGAQPPPPGYGAQPPPPPPAYGVQPPPPPRY